MDNLPEDILIIIFEYLDKDSMWSAVKVSNYWAKIFSTSSKLLRKFELLIRPQNLIEFSQVKKLPIVPITNFTIEDFNIDGSASEQFQVILTTLMTFKNSIQKLKLRNIEFDSVKYFIKIIKHLKHIEEIELENVEIDGKIQKLPELQSLKSVEFRETDDQFFKSFQNQKSIEKISVIRSPWGSDFSRKRFNELAQCLPNLIHIVMDGCGTGTYFEEGTFPYKIRKLEAYMTTFYWTRREPRIDFFKSQQGHLKELTLEKLPYDYDGGEVLKFIIEEMKLEKFYYGKIALILNGQKQQVDEFQVQEVQISSIFEMFRQFPTIRKFNLFLTQTGINEHEIQAIVNPRTSIFAHAQELEVLDHSGRHSLLSMFTGLYKNFRNISHLSFITDDVSINSVLQECLPEMTQLNEIYLNTNAPNVMERFEAIRNFSSGIKKLSIKNEFLNEAMEFFGKEIEILGI